MVVIHIKRTEHEQFLFETSCATSNEEVIRELVHIWNGRLRLLRLAAAAEELAKHGPAKPPAEQGIDSVQAAGGGAAPERGPHYNADPLGMRTGNAPAPETAAVIQRTCEEAKAAVSKDLVARKQPLAGRVIDEHIANIGGAVTIAYPMGLPEYDIVAQELDDKAELEGSQAGQEILDPETTELWWAGKEFLRHQTVGDRVGRNEKTKVVAKLQKRGGGPPAREAAISEDERRAMMAFYYKKQEEMKALAENDEDDFMHSAWANPKALKSQLLGTGNINWRPGARR